MQSWVVGWDPMPKPDPGSIMIVSPEKPLSAIHGGMILKRLDIMISVNCFFEYCIQSRSSNISSDMISIEASSIR